MSLRIDDADDDGRSLLLIDILWKNLTVEKTCVMKKLWSVEQGAIAALFGHLLPLNKNKNRKEGKKEKKL